MSLDSWIRRIGNEMLDLVYPPGLYCICCGKIIDDSRAYRLCDDCMKSMNWNTGRRCSRCGRPLSANDPGDICFGCAGREAAGHARSFDKGHSCVSYGACAQAVIFDFKYGGHSDIGDTLGEILYDRMLSEYEPDELAGLYDVVIPVPIHADKLRKRGFNHAELMGRSFAKRAGLRFDPGALIRTRSTLPMKGLGPEARRENIHGAFRVRSSRLPQLAGSSILLIDDIFTTGATIDEISSLLKTPLEVPLAMPSKTPSKAPFVPSVSETSLNYEESALPANSPDRPTAYYSGAARVDFLAFAAAGDMVI